MYTTKNFKTKKALKEAVAAWNDHQKLIVPESQPVRIFQPGPFGGNEPKHGTVALEGPHYPAPHTWYAEAIVVNGVVVKVR